MDKIDERSNVRAMEFLVIRDDTGKSIRPIRREDNDERK